jgi:hypothetical protein
MAIFQIPAHHEFLIHCRLVSGFKSVPAPAGPEG